MSESLESVIKNAFKSMLSSIEIGLPAVVNAYDHESQTVRVTPIPKIYREGAKPRNLPTLADVPVLFPGGGGFSMTFPLTPGDTVWLTFSGRGFASWLETGDPATLEAFLNRFSIGQCVALPMGPRPKPRRITSASETAMVIGEDNGAQIVIDDGRVKLGNAGVDLLDIIEQLIGALKTSVTATVTGPQPMDPATVSTLQALELLIAQIKG